jgi:Fe-S-cluster containining protein
MARLLDLNLLDFLDRCTYKKDGRISLKERRAGHIYDCILFDAESSGCTVYSARPSQCRTYPFWPWNRERTETLKAECPGVVELEPK